MLQLVFIASFSTISCEKMVQQKGAKMTKLYQQEFCE
jgi:hypothetical protein